jgi:hypothetical protein
MPDPGLFDGFKDVLAQPFAPNSAVVRLDVGVLLRFSWLNMFQPNTLFLHPFHQCPADGMGHNTFEMSLILGYDCMRSPK